MIAKMASSNFGILARSFSSSAVRAQQAVKPPIQIFGLEGRYATALYTGASKLNQLDAVEKELSGLQNQLKGNKQLTQLIVNPSIKRQIKVEAFKDVAKKASLSAPTANLLALLAENGRLKNLNTVINHFKTLMSASRGEVQCEVTSAKPLDDAQRREVEDVLKSFTKSGQKILLTTKVDPQILGGLIVSIGDKYVDMSISKKVKLYTDLIKSAA